jgi:hypothetical protein
MEPLPAGDAGLTTRDQMSGIAQERLNVGKLGIAQRLK